MTNRQRSGHYEDCGPPCSGRENNSNYQGLIQHFSGAKRRSLYEIELYGIKYIGKLLEIGKLTEKIGKLLDFHHEYNTIFQSLIWSIFSWISDLQSSFPIFSRYSFPILYHWCRNNFQFFTIVPEIVFQFRTIIPETVFQFCTIVPEMVFQFCTIIL